MMRLKPLALFHLLTSATVFAILFVLLSNSANAQSATQKDIEQLKLEIENLKKEQAEQKKLFIDEIAHLKMSDQIPEIIETENTPSQLGMAASKVYTSKSKVSIGGYGELMYFDPRNQSSGSNTNTTDAYRLVPYIGYRFNDWIIFNSEIEFEHGGADDNNTGVAVIEFMYLDFLLSENANVRVGNYLIPVGITNLKHEPVYFGSVNRPLLEKNLIPSTWHENGVLVYGNASSVLQYQAGIFNSPYAGAAGSNSNYSPSSWIRGGRQRGAKAKAEDFSGVLRLDYTGLKNSEIGFSYVYGDTSHDEAGLGNLSYSLAELHFETQCKGLEWNGLYARGTFDGAGELTYSSGTLGELVEGWYTTLSYDLMRFVDNAHYQLPVFVRYSEYDLNKEVAAGQTRNQALNKQITTVGFNYKPINQVVLKADYQAVDTKSGYEGDQFSLGMGFVF